MNLKKTHIWLLGLMLSTLVSAKASASSRLLMLSLGINTDAVTATELCRQPGILTEIRQDLPAEMAKTGSNISAKEYLDIKTKYPTLTPAAVVAEDGKNKALISLGIKATTNISAAAFYLVTLKGRHFTVDELNATKFFQTNNKGAGRLGAGVPKPTLDQIHTLHYLYSGLTPIIANPKLKHIDAAAYLIGLNGTSPIIPNPDKHHVKEASRQIALGIPAPSVDQINEGLHLKAIRAVAGLIEAQNNEVIRRISLEVVPQNTSLHVQGMREDNIIENISENVQNAEFQAATSTSLEGDSAEIINRLTQALQEKQIEVDSLTDRLAKKETEFLNFFYRYIEFLRIKDLSPQQFKLKTCGLPASMMLKTSNVATLDMQGCNIDSIYFMGITSVLAYHTTITTLDLSYSDISVGSRLHEIIVNNTVLTTLKLNNNKLGDHSAIEISKGLSINTVLTQLNLQSNQIYEQGAQFIAQSLNQNTTLAYLYLEGNPGEDAVKESINNLLTRNRNLRIELA